MKNLILEKVQEYFNAKTKIDFTGHAEADKQLEDLKHYPHAFVLACLMDRKIDAKRAWLIPYTVFTETGASDIETLSTIKEKRYMEIFNRNKLHWFNNTMAGVFYHGIQKIKQDYKGDASLIWSNESNCATVVERFHEFRGVGPKIATKATILLIRCYKICFSDYHTLDISPVAHVMRIMERLGYVPKNANKAQIINKARELNPEFPGMIDGLFWKIGTTYCSTKNPDCKACPICEACKKLV
jgi:endonuclease III